MTLVNQKRLITLTALFSLALFTSKLTKADTNPFASDDLNLVTAERVQGKCGEGKCGETKAKTKGKCGETKAKSVKKSKCGEGKCGESKAKSVKTSKCGEGKCGEGKTKKCGG